MAYEININILGDEEIEQMNRGASGGAGKSSGKAEKASGATDDKALVKFVASQSIKPFIQEVKTMVSQNVGLVTGNQELQNRINMGFQAVQLGTNAYSNAQAGIAIASKMGMSSLAGAGIGLAMTAISTAMGWMFNQIQIDTQARMENLQLQQVRSRAGIAYNRSRRGE